MNRVAVSVGVSNAALVAREGEATRAFRGRRAKCQVPGARRPMTRTIPRSTECIALALRVTEKQYPDRIAGRAAD